MKPCILLIEDDQDMRDLVSGHLEHSGFDVQRADDGIKGQALALQYTPDLILLDLMLPYGIQVVFIPRGGPNRRSSSVTTSHRTRPVHSPGEPLVVTPVSPERPQS